MKYIKQPTTITESLTSSLNKDINELEVVGLIIDNTLYTRANYNRVFKYSMIAKIGGQIILVKHKIGHFCKEYTDELGRLIDSRYEYETAHYIRKNLKDGLLYDGGCFEVSIDLNESNQIKYVYPDTQKPLSNRTFNDIFENHKDEFETRLRAKAWLPKDNIQRMNEPKAVEL